MRLYSLTGLSHGETTNLDGTKVLYDSLSVWSDGGLYAFLRSPIDIDKHHIARPQHIVLRRSHVHGWLEGQALLLKQVVTEDLLLSLFLIFVLSLQVVLDHLAVIQVKRVGHKHVHIFLQQSSLVVLSIL